MPLYQVVEMQICTRVRRWTYTVEAESQEEAIAKAQDMTSPENEGDPVGDEDFGESGWAAGVEQADRDELDAKAFDDLERREYGVIVPETDGD